MATTGDADLTPSSAASDVGLQFAQVVNPILRVNTEESGHKYTTRLFLLFFFLSVFGI